MHDLYLKICQEFQEENCNASGIISELKFMSLSYVQPSFLHLEVATEELC